MTHTNVPVADGIDGSGHHVPASIAISPNKLVAPQITALVLPRPDLMRLLDRTLESRLTIITAPAGHGKTTSVISWLRGNDVAAAWVNLDERDASLTRYAAHIATGLGRYAPHLESYFLPLLVSPDRRDPRSLGLELGDALHGLPQDTVLIIEDQHLAPTSRNLAFVAGLASAAPQRLHILLTSRRRLPLALSRLRLQGDLVEVQGADLRFTPEETADLLSLETGSPVAPVLAERVHILSGGWPAAVRLTGLGLAARESSQRDPSHADRAGGMLDFLVEEVLDHLPEHQRNILLLAALPTHFTPLLLAHLTEEASEKPVLDALQSLAELDLFREFTTNSGGSRLEYHPVFRDAFRRYLERRLAAADLQRFHQRIGDWFAGYNLIGDAVHHYVIASDLDAAAHLIIDHAQAAFDREEWQAIDGWLQQMPDAAVKERADLVLVSCWVSYLSGRWGHLRNAISTLRALQMEGAGANPQFAEIEAASFRPLGLLERDPLQAVTRAREIVAAMPRERRYQTGYAAALLSDALSVAGYEREALDWLSDFLAQESESIDAASIRSYIARSLALWRMGEVDACAQSARDALRLAQAAGFRLSAGWAQLFLARISLEQGEFDQATEKYAAVFADTGQVHFDCLREAFVGQTFAFELQGRHEEADRTTSRFRELAASTEYFEPLLFADTLEANVALLRGDLGAVASWVRVTSPKLDLNGVGLAQDPILTRIKALVALRGEDWLPEAQGLLDAFLAHVRRVHHQSALLGGLIVQALVSEAAGDQSRADQALRDSLALAKSGKVVLQYVLAGPAILPVLRRLLAGPRAEPYARHVLHEVEQTWNGMATRRQTPGAPGDALLSPREIEVLHCLERRLSSAEIADQLFISVHTVQNHVASICRKLGASGRRAAVERARSLGLIR